jgi:FkbM family methyltransferase
MHKIMKFLRLLRNVHYLGGLKYGVAAGVEHERFLSTHRFKTIIDGGANRGQFSLAARRWQPDAQIIAFEPIVECAATYRLVFKGDPNITLMQSALGSFCGQATLNIFKKSDTSSMLKLGAEVEQRIVPVTTLDDVFGNEAIAAPVLLKLDVQGVEFEVLKGAEKTLGVISDLYLELVTSTLHHQQGMPEAGEIIAWLRARGFWLRGVYDIYFDPLSGAAAAIDAHFSRKT